jgi:hypothetical protein
VVVEIYDHTQEEIVVRQAFDDSSATIERLAPGGEGRFGPALSWHVSSSGAELELQHPGDEFAESRLLGQQLFRFQAEPPGCVFVLRPDQRAPTTTALPTQPRGYPLGPAAACAPHRERSALEESSRARVASSAGRGGLS